MAFYVPKLSFYALYFDSRVSVINEKTVKKSITFRIFLCKCIQRKYIIFLGPLFVYYRNFIFYKCI